MKNLRFVLEKIKISFVVFLIGMTIHALPPAFADEEASNWSHVVADQWGACYAKSVPKYDTDPYDKPRQQGETRVYRVEKTKDILLHSYDWFAQNLFIDCSNDVASVVRLGPWHRGHKPVKGDLALAFYRDGKLLKSYSTLDVMGNEQVEFSVSHYRVFEEPPQMKWEGAEEEQPWGWGRFVVEAIKVNGQPIKFDVSTGEIIESGKKG